MPRAVLVYGEISGFLGAFAPADGNWAQCGGRKCPQRFLEARTGFKGGGISARLLFIPLPSPSLQPCSGL